MDLKHSLINELKHEAANTRKMLALVPLNNPTWKPHEKSMEMQKLAKHIATLPEWISITINNDVLDFSKERPAPKPDFTSTEEMLAAFDGYVEKAIADLEATSNETFMKEWTMRDGEKVFFTMPKIAVIRNMAFNHAVHHRGQLSVYLRLAEVALPMVYGPTADAKL